MDIIDRWLLPDGVEDVLPPQAARLEAVRRHLLDLFAAWGYDYVIPPMIEYLESLLTGTGRDLDLKTAKMVDLLTGRTLGIRADITPQVARIDAHSLNKEGVVRLCYAGTVVQARADTVLSSRIPLSAGAEMFGDTSSKADAEIVSLMVEALQSLGFASVHLDLGDVAIFRQLLAMLNIGEADQELLFAAVQKKSVAEIQACCTRMKLSAKQSDLLTVLPTLNGGSDVLGKARKLFKGQAGLLDSIANLEQVASRVARRFEGLETYFDLSELRGYAYHTGLVFSACVSGSREPVAKGGRYDHIGEVFGRGDRSATGFSVDVRRIAEAAVIEPARRQTVLVREVPEDETASAWNEMQRLRDSGYIVFESGTADEHDFELMYQDRKWQLIASED